VEKSPLQLLREGLDRLGVAVAPEVDERLWAYATTLLRWNEKVNLTAITLPRDVVEKHLVDSLAVLPEVAGTTVLDLGAGAGMPGIPLALARPNLNVTLCDAVGKKVAFMKSAVAAVGLAGRVRPEGDPSTEGLPRVDVVVSRALMDVGPWLLLARHYVARGGRVVAMLGQTPSESALETLAGEAGLELVSRRVYQLPFSGDARGVAVFASR
jgi:16S rRNA (guanine527-N7)-methyltransferase